MGEGMETPRQLVWSASPKSLSPFVIDDSGIWKTGTVSFEDSPPEIASLPLSAALMSDCLHAKSFPTNIFQKSQGRSRSRKSVRPQSSYDEDSDDDFEFSLFGRNRLASAVQSRCQGSAKFLNDCAMPEDLRRCGVKSEDEWAAALKIERQRLEHMYYASMVKLNVRLGIVSKVVECVSVVIMGLQWSVTAWLSLGVQLFFNTASALSILYRYKGGFSLPESTVLPELRDAMKQRERTCVFVQALCKILSAGAIAAFSLLAILSPQSLADVQNFFRTTYLTAGFSSGGFLSRVSLATWVSCISDRGEEKTKSLGAENAFDWLTSLFSLNTAVLSYYAIMNEDKPWQTQEAMQVGNYVQIVLAGLTGAFGLKDLFNAVYKVRLGGSPLPAAADKAPSSPFRDEL